MTEEDAATTSADTEQETVVQKLPIIKKTQDSEIITIPAKGDVIQVVTEELKESESDREASARLVKKLNTPFDKPEAAAMFIANLSARILENAVERWARVATHSNKRPSDPKYWEQFKMLIDACFKCVSEFSTASSYKEAMKLLEKHKDIIEKAKQEAPRKEREEIEKTIQLIRSKADVQPTTGS